MEWSGEILEAAEIEREKMPELHASVDVIGKLTDEAAKALGLTQETKVVCGGGDGPCSALGAGSFQNGQHFLSFGTSAWIAGTSDRVFVDKEKTLICFGHVITGKYMPCGTMQAAGSSYSYIRRALCKEEEKNAKETGESVYEILNRWLRNHRPALKGWYFFHIFWEKEVPDGIPTHREAFLESRWSMRNVIMLELY